MSKSKVKTVEILKDSISVLEFTGKSDKRFICGIDPDLTKSGIAVWDSASSQWVISQATENENISKMLSEFNQSEIVVYLEAGWMNKKSNFRKMVSARVAQNIAMKVGQNHAVGKMLAAELRSLGFETIDTKPLFKGLFKGKNGWTKLGKDHIISQTGITSRMNDEVRDALYIVLNKRK
jgi:DNA mismatch repair ATPase MutS